MKDATLSTPNKRLRVSLDDLRRNRSALMELAHISMDSHGSKMQLSQMELTEEKALFHIAIPVSEKKLLWVKDGRARNPARSRLHPRLFDG